MKKKNLLLDKEYLKRCKNSSPESKLEWLAAAVEFVAAMKKLEKLTQHSRIVRQHLTEDEVFAMLGLQYQP